MHEHLVAPFLLHIGLFKPAVSLIYIDTVLLQENYCVLICATIANGTLQRTSNFVVVYICIQEQIIKYIALDSLLSNHRKSRW